MKSLRVRPSAWRFLLLVVCGVGSLLLSAAAQANPIPMPPKKALFDEYREELREHLRQSQRIAVRLRPNLYRGHLVESIGILHEIDYLSLGEALRRNDLEELRQIARDWSNPAFDISLIEIFANHYTNFGLPRLYVFEFATELMLKRSYSLPLHYLLQMDFLPELLTRYPDLPAKDSLLRSLFGSVQDNEKAFVYERLAEVAFLNRRSVPRLTRALKNFLFHTTTDAFFFLREDYQRLFSAYFLSLQGSTQERLVALDKLILDWQKRQRAQPEYFRQESNFRVLDKEMAEHLRRSVVAHASDLRRKRQSTQFFQSWAKVEQEQQQKNRSRVSDLSRCRRALGPSSDDK